MMFPMYCGLSILLTTFTHALTAPECQYTAAPNQTALTQVRTATVDVPGYPFSVLYAAQSGFAFVSLSGNNYSLGVLDTTTFPPTQAHTIPLNNTRLKDHQGVLGLALTKSGKYLFVSAGTGAYIIDTSRAIQGANDSVVGILNGRKDVTGNEAIQVTLTHDDLYAFVSQEYGTRHKTVAGNIDVFKIDYDTPNAVKSKNIGYIDLGGSVVGSSLSPDGELLYVTSENALTNYTSAGLEPAGQHGILSVLNVTLLKTHPKRAQIANVTAGCNPVREIVSSDGQYVWVTARASNHLLGFNATALIHDPANALLASVQVGTLPVGLTFVENEKYIITADSARYVENGREHTGLSVVNVEAALSGSQDAVLGYIPTGPFPREFAVSPDNRTMLVADFTFEAIQAVDLSTLPS